MCGQNSESTAVVPLLTAPNQASNTQQSVWWRPRTLIKWSGTPAAAAEVAAPIRRLWPEYRLVSKPAASSAFLSRCPDSDRDKGLPSSHTNKCCPLDGHTARYARRADTGHTLVPERPQKINTPSPVGSVLDLRRWRRIADGLDLKFTATSCIRSDGGDDKSTMVNSPALIKPKKPTHAAAQRSRDSNCPFDNTPWS